MAMDPIVFPSSSGQDGEVRYRRPLSLPEQIAEQVSYAILAGDYGPGDPVREQDLAEKFQVSRGPIREALRLLEMEGVVRIVPNRGARVTRLSTQEVNDIFEIRAALSEVAITHLCQSSDQQVHQSMIDGAGRLLKLAHDAAAREDYVRQSYLLSMTMASASPNKRLTEMLQSLARQTIRYTLLGLGTQERRLESAGIWQKVAAAIKNGDAEAACINVNKLIIDSKDAAIRAIEEEEAMTEAPSSKPDT